MTRLLTGAGVLALVGLLIWLYGGERYNAGELAERLAWQAKTAAAERADEQHIRRVETAHAVATQDSADDLHTKLADAFARAAAHSARLRDAAPGDRDYATMSQPADTAVKADGAGEAAVLAERRDSSGQQAIVDDAACAENTVKAQGWQDWWRAVSGVGE